MSNARTLADLMGTSTTVPSSKLSSGTVLQVVQGWSDTQSKTTTSANGDAIACPATATITPSSTSSKILVMFYGMFHFGNNNDVCFWLLRDSTVIGNSTDTTMNAVGFLGTGQYSDNAYSPNAISFQYLDNPATTSAITYSIKGGGIQGTVSSGNRGTPKLASSNNEFMAWNRAENDSGSDSIASGSAFVLMEIAG
jgi:hypothetical protein